MLVTLVISADIPSSAVTLDNVEYYIQATDSIFNTTHPSTNPQSTPHEITVLEDGGEPEPKEEEQDFLTTFWWLLLLLLIVVVIIVFLLSRRREEEVGIGAIPGEETSAIEPEEPLYEENMEEPLSGEGEITDLEEEPEVPEDTDLPEEGPEPTKVGEESGTTPKQVPPLTTPLMTDEDIFESIKKKYEEGRISQKTFEEIKKRYKKT